MRLVGHSPTKFNYDFYLFLKRIRLLSWPVKWEWTENSSSGSKKTSPRDMLSLTWPGIWEVFILWIAEIALKLSLWEPIDSSSIFLLGFLLNASSGMLYLTDFCLSIIFNLSPHSSVWARSKLWYYFVFFLLKSVNLRLPLILRLLLFLIWFGFLKRTLCWVMLSRSEFEKVQSELSRSPLLW